MKNPPVIKSIEQVVAEVREKHPGLVANLDPDRNWLWLVGDLRGEHNKAVRESLGRRGIGFIFAAAGHALPSGRTSNWAHHCEHPTRFKRRGKPTSPTTTSDQPATETFSDADLLAALP